MIGEPPPEGFEDWADWLLTLVDAKRTAATIDDMLYEEMIRHVRAAGAVVPKSAAHWETAAFFGFAVAATVAILSWGRVNNYAEFRQIASAIWGWEVRPFIPALFAAGTMHPGLDRQWAERLAASMSLHDLRIIEN